MNYEIPLNLKYETLSEYIKKILKEYKKRKIRMTSVMEFGDNIHTYIWEKYGDPEEPIYPNFPEDHPYSIPLEVADYMWGTPVDFQMLPQDVPHFIEFLETPAGKEKEGWQKFREYIASLKPEDRAEELAKQSRR